MTVKKNNKKNSSTKVETASPLRRKMSKVADLLLFGTTMAAGCGLAIVATRAANDGYDYAKKKLS